MIMRTVVAIISCMYCDQHWREVTARPLIFFARKLALMFIPVLILAQVLTSRLIRIPLLCP